jgi:lysophospholipase L1-like esterase
VTLYVALGDSISIDDYSGGPGRGGASLLHRNRDDDFPDWTGRDLVSRDAEAGFALLATDGATRRTLLDVQLPRLERLPDPPTLVTVTIGGNDLLGCYGDTDRARALLPQVADAVTTTLRHPRLQQARVAVGTVYDPSDGTGDAAALRLPPWPDAVALIGELNDVLRTVAAEHGAVVAEIARQFQGHGLLAGDPTRAEARPAQRDLWFCSVIEPNAWGASGVRTAFWDALGL